MLMALFDAFVKVQVLQRNTCLMLMVSQLFGTCCDTYLFSLYYTYICFDPKVRKVVNFSDENGVYFLNNYIRLHIEKTLILIPYIFEKKYSHCKVNFYNFPGLNTN